MMAGNIGKGFVATDNILEGEIYDSEGDILSLFQEKDIFECGKCEEQYSDREEAEECCTDEDDG